MANVGTVVVVVVVKGIMAAEADGEVGPGVVVATGAVDPGAGVVMLQKISPRILMGPPIGPDYQLTCKVKQTLCRSYASAVQRLSWSPTTLKGELYCSLDLYCMSYFIDLKYERCFSNSHS